MSLSRRAFLIASGTLPVAWSGFTCMPSTRTFVIDRALVTRLPSGLPTDARIVSLEGDAWWLWHERLAREFASSRVLAGFTRPADAFVLTRLAEESGLRTTRRAHRNDAVIWTLAPA